MKGDPYQLARELARPVVRGYLSLAEAQEIAHLETQRAITSYHITRLVRRLRAIGKPRNVLLAEAHGLNGEANFPLSEDEVADLVKLVCLERKRHGGLHGGGTGGP